MRSYSPAAGANGWGAGVGGVGTPTGHGVATTKKAKKAKRAKNDNGLVVKGPHGLSGHGVYGLTDHPAHAPGYQTPHGLAVEGGPHSAHAQRARRWKGPLCALCSAESQPSLHARRSYVLHYCDPRGRICRGSYATPSNRRIPMLARILGVLTTLATLACMLGCHAGGGETMPH